MVPEGMGAHEMVRHPCPTSMRVSKMRNWLLIEYDAMRVGCHPDHETMWAGICTLAHISAFKMMVSFMLCSDEEVQSHGIYSTMNDEGKSRDKILNEIKANIDAAMECGLMVMVEPGMGQWDELMRQPHEIPNETDGVDGGDP